MFSIPYLGLYPQTTLQPTDKAAAPHLLTGLFLSKMRPLNQLLASFAPSLARSRVYKQTCPFPSLGCHRSPCRPLNRQIGLGLIDMRLIFLLHGVSTAGSSSQPCASGSMPAPLVICLSIRPPICPCETSGRLPHSALASEFSTVGRQSSRWCLIKSPNALFISLCPLMSVLRMQLPPCSTLPTHSAPPCSLLSASSGPARLPGRCLPPAPSVPPAVPSCREEDMPLCYSVFTLANLTCRFSLHRNHNRCLARR